MSYLVLARKSRPQCFAEVVGQKPVVRTLQNALRQGRVPHALIFSGVRGTGKTTLARIMAKALNCHQGPSEEPCLACSSCKEITEGISVDLQEVDGASNRGIQEIRELKEKICFMPANAPHKIILIDEVHMLTTEAFNALLKTLEEPPAHVYFMFATTEPHKVPLTILSRCQRYELKQLSHRDLNEHFQRLAEQEGVQIEAEALNMVVREARGSVRDGLSLLDQIFSYCGTEVRTVDVVDILGLVSHQLVGQVAQSLLSGDLAAIFRQLDEMYLHAADIRRFGNDLLHYFRNLLICKLGSAENIGLADEEMAQLRATASAHSADILSNMFRLLLEGLDKAALSQHPRLAMEMAFIRAVQAREVAPLADLIARFDQVLSGVDLEALPTTAAPAQSLPLQPPQSAPSLPPLPSYPPLPQVPLQEEQPPLPPEPIEEQFVDFVPSEEPERRGIAAEMKPHAQTDFALSREPSVGKNISPVQKQAVSPENKPESQEVMASSQAEATVGGSAEEHKRIRKRWPDFLDYVKAQRKPWITESLRKASVPDLRGDELLISFDDSLDCRLLKRPADRDALTAFLSDFYQRDFRVRFTVPDEKCASDVGNGLTLQQERRALANHPLVHTATEVFTGPVGDIRIDPDYRNRVQETEAATKEAASALPGAEEER